MLTTKDIEEIAVEEVCRVVRKSSILDPSINVNDKTPTWDGDIFVYKKNMNKNKENFYRRIPIQVKGSAVDKFSNAKSKHIFDLVDINNYFEDNGVILFKIEIKKEDTDSRKIFYSKLLPLDIDKKLQSIKRANQKKITIEFEELKEPKIKCMEAICLDFIGNRELQYSYKNNNLKFEYNIDDYDNIIIPTISNNNIFEKEHYIYGKKSGIDAVIPLDIVKIEAISFKDEMEVKIGDIIYYHKCKKEKYRSSMIIVLGNNIILNLLNNKIVCKKTGNLHEIVHDATFFYHFYKEGYFYINNKKVSIENIKEIKQIENDYKYLKDIEKLFSILKIDMNRVYLDTFNQEDYKCLNWLIQSIVYEKTINLNKISDNLFINPIKISNIEILIICIKQQNNEYKICNYFSDWYKKYEIFIGKEGKKEYNISLFLQMKSEHFKYNNIDLNEIKESIYFMKPDSEVQYDAINNFILEIIKFYDKNKERRDILDLAYDLSVILIKYDKDSIIYKLNYYQIIKRIRDFNKQEIEDIIDIKLNEKGTINIICAINILLDNKNEFEYYFKKLSDGDKKNFCNFPIYNLIK